MDIKVLHYETSTDETPYDVDEYKNVHSVDMDLTHGKSLSFITADNRPVVIKFSHPVYIEFGSKTS